MNTYTIIRYERIRSEFKGYSTAAELRVLREASIVGFTTSGAAAHQQLFRAIGARIVVSCLIFLKRVVNFELDLDMRGSWRSI